ncbi:MAG: hypothetical protein JSW27_00245 [Phycisphaerales bacterium]|nr:MAG: hypothetical protein JSW27_00245 [Phycisphaerales bacterium]
MLKGFAVTAALVFLLLLSSGAVATYQFQSFGLGQTNYVGMSGNGVAGNINTTVAAVDQLATGPGHTVGYQSTVGSLTQAAGAVGMGGLLEVYQVGDALGGQLQVPGADVQSQDLGADLAQNITQLGGDGSALGLQTFVGFQMQLSFNPWGGGANVQGIGVSLYDAVGSTGNGAIAVGGSADLSAGQN